ncbi:uncharacterized protein LOC119663208, partial [Teleopsis dalmanni]|uniref:uncharacterized protein LOC119663208 n=1 Tax=Teleopsis dalmanni TaxID=139649 RepID=UPI0018CC8CCF
MLIENNNRQTNINSVIQNQINELTDRINDLKTAKNSDNSISKDEEILKQHIMNRNNYVINHLDNLALSVVLAKNNMINPLILDNVEINDLIDSENVPLSLNTILSVSDVKVLQNKEIILYVIKVPRINKYC